MSRDFDIRLIPGADGRWRAAFYARYSSTRQKKASTTDQYRNCREASDANGWVVADESCRADEEKSGTTLTGREGIKDLIAMAKQVPRPFDILVIDESSRLGRRMADVFHLLDIFDHYGVRVYFVSDDLMSGTEWFRDAFTQKARADEQFSKTHGKRVRRGRIGRFEEGFNPGGGCYGYRNEKVYDYTKKGDHGEPGILGMKQVIDAEEAKIVLLIFTSYDGGMSDLQIACMLNERKIPPPQATRKRDAPSWSKHAIQTILTNNRYRGHLTYGCTRETRNPETGLKERKVLPVEEWLTREDPELRIIDEELFTRVQERRRARATKIGVKQIGGMSHALRVYLLGGLLKCGLCEHNMTIRTTNPPRYGCSDHQNRGECPNRATIRQEDLEAALLHALALQLESDELREDLVQFVFNQLQSTRDNWLALGGSEEEQRRQLEESRRNLLEHQANLVKAVKERGGIRALYDELQEVQERLGRIDEILSTEKREPEPEVMIEDVRKFVAEQIGSVERLLHGDREALRDDFQRRISKVVLTPIVDDRGVLYKVSGDVDLFTLPQGVEQTNQVHLMGLRYILAFSCEVLCYQNRRKWTKALSEAPGTAGDAGAEAGEPVAGELLLSDHHWTDVAAPAEASVLIDRDGVGSGIETVAGLAGEFSDDLKSAGTDLLTEAEATLGSNFEYREGFGGLRLATTWQSTQSATMIDASIA